MHVPVQRHATKKHAAFGKQFGYVIHRFGVKRNCWGEYKHQFTLQWLQHNSARTTLSCSGIPALSYLRISIDTIREALNQRVFSTRSISRDAMSRLVGTKVAVF